MSPDATGGGAPGRHLVLSCGTSLKDSLCWRDLRDALGLQERTDLRLGSPSVGDADRKATQAWLDKLWTLPDGKRAVRIAEQFDVSAWSQGRRAHLSAELVELRLLDATLQRRGEAGLGPTDTVSLIHDHGTPEAALALKAILQGHGAQLFPQRGAPAVDLQPVRGLDARDPDGYNQGLAALVAFLDALDPGVERIYGITGGFKATVACCTLGALRDFQRQPTYHQSPWRQRVRICYVHMESDGLVWLGFDAAHGGPPASPWSIGERALSVPWFKDFVEGAR